MPIKSAPRRRIPPKNNPHFWTLVGASSDTGYPMFAVSRMVHSPAVSKLEHWQQVFKSRHCSGGIAARRFYCASGKAHLAGSSLRDVALLGTDGV